MNSSDSNSQETRDIISRTLLTVIRLARKPDQPELNEALNSLQKAVAGQAEPGALARAAESVKSAIVKYELNAASPGTPPPEKEGDVSCTNTACLQEFKNSYVEILGELQLDIEPDYLENISELRKKITLAKDIETVLSYREEILEIARWFADLIFEERNGTTVFIAEVAHKLAELEKVLTSSVLILKKNYKANQDFSLRLQNEIHQAADSVKSAGTLDVLQKIILNKLSLINATIKSKQKQDKVLIQEASGHLGGVKAEFGTIQERLHEVEHENLILLEKLKTDSLTGALNRLAYEEHISAEMQRFLRYGRIFSLAIFDIDNFKDINDRYGHIIGDKCLQESIRKVKAVLRKNDTLARYGGDEFVVILPESVADKGREVAEKIREVIDSTEFTVKGRKIPLTISVGLTEVNPSDNSANSVFNRADTALYEAKRAGRNRIKVL